MLKNIQLKNITLLPNYRVIDEDPAEMDHLVQSIKKDGILQPGLVRENKKKKGFYELVFGNRRFNAAQLAGIAEFPAQIKDVADDDILEYQVIENLQRKDVHPMDEGAAYKAYKEKHKCDMKELAAKFSKPERYIAHRLVLTNLIPEIQKDFTKKQLSIAQAEVFAKLLPDQQKQLMKQNQYNGKYSMSIDSMKSTINRMFFHKLSSVPWNKEDKTLIPSAGSCIDCKKRTACQSALFEDITKDDQCLDSKCYAAKLTALVKHKADDVINNQPDVALAYSPYGTKPDAKIMELAKKMKVPVLNDQTDFGNSKYSNFTVAKKVLWLNNESIGHIKTVYIKGAAKAVTAGKGKANNVQLQVAAINQRVQRAGELAYEKAMEKIQKAIEEKMGDDNILQLELSNTFGLLNHFINFRILNYMHEEFLEKLKLSEDQQGVDYDEDPHLLANRLRELTPNEQMNLFARVFFQRFGKVKSKGSESFMLRLFAEWLGIDLKQYDDEVATDVDKRKQSAEKRIAALQKEEQARKVKPVTKKAANKK